MATREPADEEDLATTSLELEFLTPEKKTERKGKKRTSKARVIVSRKSVRVKGGKSLRNGMWNGVRNGIIMRNTICAGKKLTEERILFSHQFHKSSGFFDVADYIQPNNNKKKKKASHC